MFFSTFVVYTRRRWPHPSRKTMAALGQVELLHLLEWLWRPMREWQSLSQKLQVCVVADWSVGFTVVSTQVNSIQIEVVSRQHRSRFDTSRKSIRFNSMFRPVAGGEAGAPPRNFQISIKFRYKSGILLTEMDRLSMEATFSKYCRS